MAFYLTYRPQSIEELDLENVRTRLVNIFDSPNPPHAFLFAGPRGLGKTSAARIIAKIINCQAKTKKPCNKCPICTSITNGTNLDVLEIDAASNRGIDEIRSLREKIKLAPTTCQFKVYIIDEVHMLTPEAFNALLKTLEEPPPHAFFILATTEPQKLPDTIISRCFQVDFKKAQKEEIIRSIDRIIKAEKLKVADSAKFEIAKYADGSFREAAKILEEASFKKKKIDSNIIREILGQNLKIDILEFLELLQKYEVAAALLAITEISASFANLKFFIRLILETLHTHLLALNGLKTDEKTNLKLDIAQTQKLINLFQKAYQELKSALIPTLPLELAVIEFCQQPADLKKTKPLSPKKSDNNILSITKTKVHPLAGTDDVFLTREPAKSENKKKPPSKTSPKTSSNFSLEEINDFWPKILEALKAHNHSVSAVLRGAKPINIEGNILTIEAFYKFHQERISQPKVLKLIEDTISDLLESKIIVECCLGQKAAANLKNNSSSQKTDSGNNEDDLVQYVEEIFN